MEIKGSHGHQSIYARSFPYLEIILEFGASAGKGASRVKILLYCNPQKLAKQECMGSFS